MSRIQEIHNSFKGHNIELISYMSEIVEDNKIESHKEIQLCEEQVYYLMKEASMLDINMEWCDDEDDWIADNQQDVDRYEEIRQAVHLLEEKKYNYLYAHISI